MTKLFRNYKGRLGIRIVFYLVFVYIFLFCLIEFNIFNYFDYNDFDLAIYNQVIWNTLHGKFFYSSIRGGIYFKDHLPLILLIFLPPYAIFQSPLTLLFLQSIFLGLAAWPLFLLAKEELQIEYCIGIVFLYLIYPPVGLVNLFEFHPDAFTPLFLLFTFYFLIKNKFNLFVIFMILSLLCKEDVSIAVLMLGVYAAFIKKSKRWIFTPLFSGIIWFTLSIFIVIPYFNKGQYSYTVFYSHLGNSFPEMIRTAISHPILVLKSMFSTHKLKYLIQLFVPVSFLSFFNLPALLITIPTFMRNLLSANPATSSINYQYTATLIPFIFISTVYGLKRILMFNAIKKYSNVIITLVLFTGVISSWILGPQLHLINEILIYRSDYLDKVREKFILSIPKDASIIATFGFLPKLSNREKLYTFHYVYFGREKVEKKKYILPKDTEYALIDFRDYLTFHVFYTPEGGKNIRRFLEEGNWGIVKIVDDIVLMKPNYISDYKFYELIDHPIIQNKEEIAINERLAFMGYDVDKRYIDRIPILYLSFYWKCIEKIHKDYLMVITISDKEGKVILQKAQELCYNIYPTSDWSAGEIIKANYWIKLPLNIHRTEYRIDMALKEH